MTARPRKRYDDKFRASAVIMLEAAGYPDKKGALTQVSNHTGVPLSTLRGWYDGSRNPPPSELRHEKKGELIDWINRELEGIFGDLPDRRQDASYKDLIIGVGVLTEKRQLLSGKPTQIIDDIDNEERTRRINAILDAGRARRDRQADSGHHTTIMAASPGKPATNGRSHD